MAVLLTNNAVSRLSAALSATATTLSVTAGTGARFPAPVAGSNQWFPVTLIKDDGSLEICRCHARSGDTLTIVRAQEGTAALSFSVNDRVELRLTASALAAFAQQGESNGFSSLELSAATPFLDFHYNFSAQDFTARIVADGDNALTIYSALQRLMTIQQGNIDVNGDVVARTNLLAFGGILQLGNPTATSGAAIQVRNDGALRYTGSGSNNWGAWGSIWTSSNLNPDAYPRRDAISWVGVDGSNGLPYMRRSADNGLIHLQPNLGFAPVRQGGGSEQLTNIIQIGWSNYGRLKVQVDVSDLGFITTRNSLNSDIVAISSVGGIGTYAMLRNQTGADVGPGIQYSGSQLIYSSSNPANGSSAAGGTWRCMGNASNGAVTLFLRVL